MRLLFLTPWGASLGLAVLVPLLALHLVRRRARRTRGVLGLVEPSRRRLVPPIAALLGVGALLALAAAQPVLARTLTVRVRTDAEAFVVLDISRSMLASRGAGSPKRVDRAKSAALALRSTLPDVPVGVASLTDRVLPHLFPSADERTFTATITNSLGIERPPPRSSIVRTATRIETLASVRTQRYFSPSARKRLLLVLTDGETQPVAGAQLRALFRRPPVIDVVFVQFWHADERVYSGGTPELAYRPDKSSTRVLGEIAESVSGRVFAEDELDAAARRARELVGSGPMVVRGDRDERIPLAPFLLAAALAPLALLLALRDR